MGNKILIVDDQESNITVLEKLLTKRGYENYKSLSDPRLVIQTFQESRPDLLLLDLMMPHMDGFAVMQALKPLIPEGEYFPILALTADFGAETKKRALSGGATDFLTKPFDTTEVTLRIGNLLQTRALHLRLQHQNVLLDEKVEERTAQLRQRADDLGLVNLITNAINQGKSLDETLGLMSMEFQRVYDCIGTIAVIPDEKSKCLRIQRIDFRSHLLAQIEKLAGGNLSSLPLKIPMTGDLSHPLI